MAVTKRCVVCGKLYQARTNSKTCSLDCRKIRNRKINNANHVRRYHEMIIKNDLAKCKSDNMKMDINKANELGMSYGRYKALQYLKSM